MSKIEFQVENARLLEKLPNVDSYNGWKSRGKQVKKGAKQRAYRVQAGTIQRFDPITGEGYSEPRYVTAYGFGADQVYYPAPPLPRESAPGGISLNFT